MSIEVNFKQAEGAVPAASMGAEGMVPSLLQDRGRFMRLPSPAPTCRGAVTHCHNMRAVCADGMDREGNAATRTFLERVHAKAVLLHTSRRPVGLDRRGGRVYLFTQERGGELWCEGYIPPSGRGFVCEPRVLGTPGGEVREMAGCGPLVALVLGDGSLEYLHRGEGGYTLLGAAPSVGVPVLRAVDAGRVQVSFPSVKFPTPVKDVTDLPGSVRESVTEAWRDTLDLLQEQSMLTGGWIAPVWVRLGLRLWDGSLFALTDAVMVAPPDGPAVPRVSLPMVYDSKGDRYTGVEGTDVSLPLYAVSLEGVESVAGPWRALVQGVEVWVGREPRLWQEGVLCSCHAVSQKDGNYLSARAPMPVSWEGSAPPLSQMGMLEFAPCGDEPYLLLNHAGVEWRGPDAALWQSMPQGGVEASLGYNGHLHVACSGGVYTSVQGNPFVRAGCTRGTGERVTALAPQLSGGGAYTRQYLYVATGCGITALTHDYNGRHTNSRPIAEGGVRESALLLPTPEGVYAVTGEGSLLRLRDARAEPLMQDTSGVESLLWDHVRSELYLCTGTGVALVLRPCMGMSAYTRELAGRGLSGARWPGVCVCTQEEGGEGGGEVAYTLLSLEEEESTRGCSPCALVTHVPAPSGMRCFGLHLVVSGLEARGEYNVTSPWGAELASGVFDSTGRTEVAAPLYLPRALFSRREGEVLLRVQGEWERVEYVGSSLQGGEMPGAPEPLEEACDG